MRLIKNVTNCSGYRQRATYFMSILIVSAAANGSIAKYRVILYSLYIVRLSKIVFQADSKVIKAPV